MKHSVTITVIVVTFVILACPVAGERSKRQVSACTFVPVNNASFVENIYHYFDEDSKTRILEYNITLITSGNQTFPLTARSGPDAFQPWRWFRTQGVGSSNLLLVYHYYYGLMKPYMGLGIDKIDVQLTVTPPGCLNTVVPGQLHNMIRDYLLRDFNIDEDAVEEPFTYSEDVEMCTAHVEDVDGWGRLVYRCCGLDEEERLHCEDIYEDAWVWILRAFVITMTILLFLYFPVLIPKGYRIYTYVYYPPDELKFNFRLTTNPESFRYSPGTQILRPHHWRKLRKFQAEASKLQTDVTYTGHIKRVDFSVCMDRILEEGGSPVNMKRSFFDALVRCKLRHSDPLEDCCRAPACGQHCFPGCPPWQSWFRALRTIIVMAVLALPSLPFMYAMAADNLDYQQLADTYENMGLERTFNFYVGPIFGKIMVAVLAFMYTLHCVIVIVDGATDENISRLYTDVLDVAEKKDTIRKRIVRAQSILRKACQPVKKCGVLIVPLWILAFCLLPIYAVFSFIFKAPMFRVISEALKKLVGRSRLLRRSHDDGQRIYNFCEIFWFTATIIFVFIVLTIGANFLVHVVAMIIVKVLVDAQLVYRVLPVVLLILLYVRDSFNRVGERYQTFLGTVLGTIKNKEAEDLRRECLKSWEHQQNKIFKIIPEPAPFDADDEVVKSSDKGYITMSDRPERECNTKLKEKKLFLVKNGNVRLHLKQLLLFLNKNDFLYMSEKFLFHCCSMDCAGAPGCLEENYIKATLDFLKIGVFLLFVFLVVMAYGNAYYISPTNQMFVTLVSGLVPLVLRNLFLTTSAVQTVDTSNYRFEAQLKEKIETFSQSWDVEDIILKDVEVKSMKSTIPLSAYSMDGHTIGTWNMDKISTVSDKSTVDLVLDVSSEYPDTVYIGNGHHLKPKDSKQGRIGVMDCTGCKGDGVHGGYDNGEFGEPCTYYGENYDMEANNGERVRGKNEGRWIRNNGGMYSYDNERHRAAVNRAHENRTNEIVAGIDAHLVTNTLLGVFGMAPENPSSGGRSQPDAADSGNTRSARSGDLLDANTRRGGRSGGAAEDSRGHGGLESRAMGGLDARGGGDDFLGDDGLSGGAGGSSGGSPNYGAGGGGGGPFSMGSRGEDEV